MNQPAAQVGPFAPLALPVFRALWIASVVSSIGTAMQGVGATWVLVGMHASPSMLALLQAASSIPLFVLGLPAGVLADIVDRRRLLIVANVIMVVAAALLAVFAHMQRIDAAGLVALTLLMGAGAALAAPAFQAIVPELASGAQLMPAISLNSAGMNIGRTVGPALGGLVAAELGTAAVFALNALSTLGVVAVLYRWRRPQATHRLPSEHFWGATRASVRYAAFAPGVQRVLMRAVLFFFFASAAWALLPVIASKRLALGAGGYGLLLGAMGVGAIAGAVAMPTLRKHFPVSSLAVIGSVVCALTTVLLGFAHSTALVIPVLLVFGGGWINTLTLLNSGVQSTVAGWVRARMLALYVVVYFGTFSAGSLVWGALADHLDSGLVLALAGGLGLLSSFGMSRMKPMEAMDLTPVATPDAALLPDSDADHGSVIVVRDYQVEPANRTAFSTAMAELRRSRRRTGAISWRHWVDPEDPTFHRESFVVESLTEHLRQVSRRTQADAEIEARVEALSPSAPIERMLRAAPKHTS